MTHWVDTVPSCLHHSRPLSPSCLGLLHAYLQSTLPLPTWARCHRMQWPMYFYCMAWAWTGVTNLVIYGMHHSLRHYWPRNVWSEAWRICPSVCLFSLRESHRNGSRYQSILSAPYDRRIFRVSCGQISPPRIRDLLPTSALKTGTHFIGEQA